MALASAGPGSEYAARGRSKVAKRQYSRRNLLIAAVLFIAAGLVPLFCDGYPLQLAISIVMYTALATSWLLFSGPTNYIALSTAAFFGIGMYTAAGGIELLPYPILVLAAGLAGAAAFAGGATACFWASMARPMVNFK